MQLSSQGMKIMFCFSTSGMKTTELYQKHMFTSLSLYIYMDINIYILHQVQTYFCYTKYKMYAPTI